MLFEECQINVNRNGAPITAPSTSVAAPYGITFIGCEVTADEVGFNGEKISKIYLGRAWKDAAKSVWIRCKMPAVLEPAGWEPNMKNGNVQDDKKIFAEWGCTYADSADADLSKRQHGGRALTDEEAANYTFEKIFAGIDHLAKTKYEVELK
jgi:pectinesterase